MQQTQTQGQVQRRSQMRTEARTQTETQTYCGARPGREGYEGHVERVVVLALDGVYPFELGIPNRVFGSAEGRYEVLTCTVDGGRSAATRTSRSPSSTGPRCCVRPTPW